MAGGDWQPNADGPTLLRRTRLFADIRRFFAERDVLEVDTPALSAAAAQEPQLASIACQTAHGPRYLHTSAEFGLKRLLAAGSGPVYQLSHVFRDGEVGRWHNPEFTLLEWYRPGSDYRALMDEVTALLAYLDISAPKRCSFAEAFATATNLDPHTASTDALAACAARRGVHGPSPPPDADDARRYWLDLLASLVLEPALDDDSCLLYDFPATLAGLTRIRTGPPPVAERFELYWRGVELANGGNELTDARELARRFKADREARRRQGLHMPPADQRLLAAIQHGLPECAGVALGVDRLLALQAGFNAIAPVLPFADGRA